MYVEGRKDYYDNALSKNNFSKLKATFKDDLKVE